LPIFCKRASGNGGTSGTAYFACSHAFSLQLQDEFTASSLLLRTNQQFSESLDAATASFLCFLLLKYINKCDIILTRFVEEFND